MITNNDREKLRTAAIGETVTLEDGSRVRVDDALDACCGCKYDLIKTGHACYFGVEGIVCFSNDRPDRESVIFVNAD